MNAVDYIVVGVIIIAAASAVIWLIRRRKKGCGGCPYAGTCGGKCDKNKK